jgi:hypothetical protein
LKEALLADVRANKNTLYNFAVAMATRIDVTDERVAFTFAANQSVPRIQLEQNREWIEAAVQRLAGRRLPVAVLQSETPAPPHGQAPAQEPPPPSRPAAQTAAGDKGAGSKDARSEAMSSPAVQALLDVFPAEIRDVEEM